MSDAHWGRADAALHAQNPTVAPADARGRGAAAGRWRWLLLGCILLAYSHVVIGLGSKDFWWDESLSLQRAEEGWGALLRGTLLLYDGFTSQVTTDQHPFFSFLLQGILLRLAGDSEFVLRYVAAMAATLLAPTSYVLARALIRRGVLPAMTDRWTVLLAASHPFFLWYGQEARPYALWAMLAVLSTYLLAVSTEPSAHANWRRAGYGVTLAMFLTTHFYAVFLLPVHALFLLLAWPHPRRWLAALAAVSLLVLGSLIGGYVAWVILIQQGGGANFPSVSLRLLIPDLLNAFSLGLSVNISQVWWLDLVFGGLLIIGVAWMVRSRASLAAGGWILPLWILTPVAGVLLINLFQPLYMNARHLSLLGGVAIIAFSAGLAVIARWQRWVALLLTLALLVGFGYSTYNYYSAEEYAKDDFTRLGDYMHGRIMPGDLVLIYPPAAWRIFYYYVDLAPVDAAMAAGQPLAVHGVPLLNRSFEETEATLATLSKQYRRIWVLGSNTNPYMDLEGRVETWLKENVLRLRDVTFFSHSSLRAQLHLPKIPVYDGNPPAVQNSYAVEFGNRIRLIGFDVDNRRIQGFPTPITLYWQTVNKTDARYKYILKLVARQADGTFVTLSAVEREPYEGDIPTNYWDPGKTIAEYVELAGLPETDDGRQLFLQLQLYDNDTLDKLPVTQSDGGVKVDETTIMLSWPTP